MVANSPTEVTSQPDVSVWWCAHLVEHLELVHVGLEGRHVFLERLQGLELRLNRNGDESVTRPNAGK